MGTGFDLEKFRNAARRFFQKPSKSAKQASSPAPVNSAEDMEEAEVSADGTISADNPWLNARRTWNDHVGAVISQKQWWQIIGLFSLCIALALSGGMIYVASQSKFIPYVVQTDAIGNVGAVGPVQSTVPADVRIIRSALVSFIHDARLVTPDVQLQRKAVFNLYAHLSTGDPATVKMNEWLNSTPESTPFARAAKEMVSIDIRSALQQTGETWQIEWTETTRDRKGTPTEEPAVWRALITVYQSAPKSGTTEEQMRTNPLGIYVRDFSWSRLN
jgi:type IV secretion system protein VirB5